MKKLIAVCVLSCGSLFILGCADRPSEPRTPVVSKPLFGASTPFNNAGQCLGNDAAMWASLVGLPGNVSPANLGCTSNDVMVTNAVATEVSVDGGVTWIPLGSAPISCTVGQVITLRMTATLQEFASSDRYNIGLWVATDGGDAKGGSCNHYNLPVNPALPGTSDLDGGSCGDLSAFSSTGPIDLGEVTTICQAGPSGQVEISMCTAWQLPGSTRQCPEATLSGADAFRAGTLPSATSRCNCQPIVIQTAAPTTGTITIIADAVPNDAQDFAFVSSGGFSPFVLDDDADPTLPNTRVFTGVAPGSYSVTEDAVTGWSLTDLTCTGGGANTTVSLATRTASIGLEAGENVTCTFTNAKATGSITIVHDAIPDDPQDFGYGTSGSGLSDTVLDDDADPTLPNSRTFAGLLAGTYSVTDQGAPGFDLTALTCTAGGSGDLVTGTATITLAVGANVTCTFQNTKRAIVTLNKRENGVLPLTRPWAFEVRTGASILAAGSVVASGTANLTTGVVSFACTLSTLCTNVGGLANLKPGAYQVCEVGMPSGYTNNITSPPGFTPGGGTPEGGANASECVNVTLAAGQSGVPGELPTAINNVTPPATGGDITLGAGSFTLANDVMGGSFDIRNSTMGTQSVFLTSLTIINATFKDGPNTVQASVTGCTFTPLPVLIPASATQTITLSGCHVAPSVRKEMMFTVRATINNGNQPFYDRVYKVRTQ